MSDQRTRTTKKRLDVGLDSSQDLPNKRRKQIANIGSSAPKPASSPPRQESSSKQAASSASQQASSEQTSSSKQASQQISSSKPSTYHGFDSSQVTRLMIQSLYDMGFHKVAKDLENESGCSLEAEVITKLRNSIKQGNWKKAENYLQSVMGASSKNCDRQSFQQMAFLIRRQNMLEVLKQGNNHQALEILRTSLAPLNMIPNRKQELQLLSRAVVSGPDDLHDGYIKGWSAISIETSRSNLMLNIQKFLSPSLVLPPHRLASLLKQVKAHQIGSANYPNFGDSSKKDSSGGYNRHQYSLYEDYRDDKSIFPDTTSQVLIDHTDEVWCLEFSHSGKYLATASKDTTIKIYEFGDEQWEFRKTLKGHKRGVIQVTWSPDDSQILSCGEDKTVRIWDYSTGLCVHINSEHKDTVSSCIWVPVLGQGYITSSPDKQMIWRIDGKVEHKWIDDRIMSMTMSPDCRLLVGLTHQGSILFYDWSEKLLIREAKVGKLLTSVSISKDSNFALVSVHPDEVHLWDLRKFRIVKKFVGQVQKDFYIRSSFGGEFDQYILSGSQDQCIYVWNRYTTSLIHVAMGHKSSVNTIRWNNKCSVIGGDMYASASDDHTVRIWRPSEYSQKFPINVRQEESEMNSVAQGNGYSNGQEDDTEDNDEDGAARREEEEEDNDDDDEDEDEEEQEQDSDGNNDEDDEEEEEEDDDV